MFDAHFNVDRWGGIGFRKKTPAFCSTRFMKPFSFYLPFKMRVTQSSKLEFFRPAAKMDISACQLSTCQHSRDCQAQDMKVETAVDDFFPLTFA